MALSIEAIPAFEDNYIWLIRDGATGETAVVDPGQSEPVLEALNARGWKLDCILNTHHHWDHVSGNRALKRITQCKIIGGLVDHARIPGLSVAVGDGDTVRLGESEAQVLFTPGHTRGHICFWFREDKALFCGDTLFLLSCGMLLEGDAPTLHRSLQRIATLPEDTRLYCAHEYTVADGAFAKTVDPRNEMLHRRIERDLALRARGEPTVPGRLGEELRTNPFMRVDQPEIAAALGMHRAQAADVFAALRHRKDHFKPGEQTNAAGHHLCDT